MNTSTLQSLSSLTPPDVVAQISTALNETPGAVNRAISAVFPVLLRGMELGVRQPKCLDALFSLVNHKSNDGRLLSNVAEAFADQSQTALMPVLGDRLLRSLFGDHLNIVALPIADYAGIAPRSADALLHAAAQIVLSDFGQRLRGAGRQNPATLSALVLRDGPIAGQPVRPSPAPPRPDNGQDASLAGRSRLDPYVVPINRSSASAEGFYAERSGAVGGAFAGRSGASADTGGSPDRAAPARRLGEVARSVTSTITGKARSHDQSSSVFGVKSDRSTRISSRGLKWRYVLWPVIAALAAVFVMLNYAALQSWWRGGPDGVSISGARTGAAVSSPGAGSDPIGQRGGRFALDVPADSMEARVIRYIEGNRPLVNTEWFEFDRITFQIGSNALTAYSAEQVRNIAAIMNTYPTVRLKIGGYTDNVGEPASNLRLSDARANTVMRALVELGIAPERLTSEGYGEQHPIADNSTPEGRAKNRRIAFRITQR